MIIERKFRRILVTGGAGFIGINFCKFLLKKNIDPNLVEVIDALTYASNESEFEKIGLTLHETQIQDRGIHHIFEMANKEGRPFDLVINFAAESHVDQSIDSPNKTFETNALGVANLLEAIRKFAKSAIYVQIGTDEVYGDVQQGESSEGDLLLPSSPYSASKAAADLLTLAYCRTYGIHGMITRCTNNFGKYQNPEKFIPRVIWKAIHDQEIPIYGDGLQSREWIHVEDHVAAIWEVATKGNFGQIYNIGSSFRITNLELTKLILKALNSKSRIAYVEDRVGHDRRYALSSEKIFKEIGYFPKKNVVKEIIDIAEWYESEFQTNSHLIEKVSYTEDFYRGRR